MALSESRILDLAKPGLYDFHMDTRVVERLAHSSEVQARCPVKGRFPNDQGRQDVEWIANNYCVCEGNLFWAEHYNDVGHFWNNWKWIPSYGQLAEIAMLKEKGPGR